MIVIKDFDTTINTEFEQYKTITGHQMNDYTILAFRKIVKQPQYGWQLFTFDQPIVDGEVKNAFSVTWTLVDPDGFIFNGEAYKIEADI